MFRHMHATYLLGSGVDLATVSSNLGHAQKSTTSNIYSHKLNSAGKRSAEIMGNILSGSSKKSEEKLPGSNDDKHD